MSVLWWRRDADTADGEDAGASSGSRRTRSKADVVIETGLTPEEYILAEIEANGGSMKQQTICEVTGWSDGCVSRTLSRMEAEGMIARVRVGHKKIVVLPVDTVDVISP